MSSPSHSLRKTRVLLDNSIMTRRSRMHWIKQSIPDGNGGVLPTKLIVAERMPALAPREREAEAEAILTVGRLLREKRIEAVTSMELTWEAFRDYLGSRILDAFDGCDIGHVPAPVERGRFIQADLESYIKKGGRKDRASGSTSASQISFFKQLTQLDQASVEKVTERAVQRGLTDFELDSFRDLEWFKTLCQRLRSDENLPDAFHLWTARRNQLDVFLTLDLRLINQAASIAMEKSGFKLDLRVQTPIQFLNTEGIETPDPYPFQAGRFYSMGEVESISFKTLSMR